ncbi:MAG: DUF58 domain-containing protein [Litorimonas sp.]
MAFKHKISKIGKTRLPEDNTLRASLYPTRRAAILMALGLPITLLTAAFIPALWTIGAAWLAAMAGLIFLDGFMATPIKAMKPDYEAPSHFYIGESEEFWVQSIYGDKSPVPKTPQLRLSVNDRLSAHPNYVYAQPNAGGVLSVFTLTARRRGEAVIERLWQRWQGPLGLMWRQRVDEITLDIPVIPNTRLVKEKALEIFTRDATFGNKIQDLKGEGTEFDALTEFMPGMDKRTIDWKHSARHNQLLAREYRTERNHNIIFAFDSGHLMSEDMTDPQGRAVTKLDRALNAALLMSFVSLKIGDRVGLYAFDRKPYLYTPPIAGTHAFAQLQKLSAQIDYSISETNFTLGLSQLAQNLKRRTLIVIFTDFVDTTQAELMLENMGRLLRRHIVIFVAFRNQALEDLITRPPENSQDVAASVIAETLIRERDIVIARLKRMGAHIVDADPDTLNMSVLNSYLELKARNAI